MKIGELWVDAEKPTIDGDWIRGILVLGRVSKNPADTHAGIAGKSRVNRKYNRFCESASQVALLDKAKSHIGPHRYDGNYPDHDRMGTFHNPNSVAKGIRMDMLCRKIGESYHPQAAALRDNIEHDRPFGGFSPLFDGECDASTGEVEATAVISIDWVPNPSTVKSIAESETEADPYEERFAGHEKRMEDAERRIGECEAFGKRYTGESEARRVAESHSGGARTVPPPAVVPAVQTIDPFKFARGQK